MNAKLDCVALSTLRAKLFSKPESENQSIAYVHLYNLSGKMKRATLGSESPFSFRFLVDAERAAISRATTLGQRRGFLRFTPRSAAADRETAS